ncbi:MAG: ATP-dependent DNA helicase RecG [Flavobacteriales bacterium]
MELLSTPIDFLKGVGPAKADLLKKELRIFTYRDLITYYPFRYVDKSKIFKVSDLNADLPFIQLKGEVLKFETIGKGRAKRLVAHFKDDTGIIKLIWFKGTTWIRSSIKLNTEYLVFGKPTSFKNTFSLVHPELDLWEDYNKKAHVGLQGVYHSSEKLSAKGLNSRGILKLIKNLIPLLKNDIKETLSLKILTQLNLPTKEDSLINIHIPKNNNDFIRAQKRLKFEEFFFLQLHLLKLKLIRTKRLKGYPFPKIDTHFNNFYNNHIPFELTGAQKRVLKEIRRDVQSEAQMNRLLQGDVGSGKTLVAFLSMLIAVDNGFQSAIMAPTEILARQHMDTISEYCKELDVKVGILTGSSKTKERKELHEKLESGELNILIGTHALIEDKVKFRNLGLVIIDEQHRFGVSQRSKLWKKNDFPPHMLVMTATPIPRTLSMTLYGDLEVSVIDELPPGRKEVKTVWKTDSNRLKVIGFIREQIKLGRQIYIVFPLIQESEVLDYKNLMDGYESLIRDFPLPEFQVSVLHGQMKAEDKEYEMKRFVDGVTDIMVATTVIEVGVNVPNASVMIIESSERFGLSQLHQLRGRVGRGAEQSYCILMSGNKVSIEGKERLKTMVETSDGFKISEVDLRLRGAGDMMGTKQSGALNFKIADLVKDGNILEYSRNVAIQLLEEDENLENEENKNILKAYLPYAKKRNNWSRIS